jgi:hypothetical protein
MITVTEALALPEVASLVESNKRIEAMRQLRALTGCDLTAAKAAVEGAAPPLPAHVADKWIEVAPGLWEPQDQARARLVALIEAEHHAACTHGHFDCATREGGPCSNEAAAELDRLVTR